MDRNWTRKRIVSHIQARFTALFEDFESKSKEAHQQGWLPNLLATSLRKDTPAIAIYFLIDTDLQPTHGVVLHRNTDTEIIFTTALENIKIFEYGNDLIVKDVKHEIWEEIKERAQALGFTRLSTPISSWKKFDLYLFDGNSLKGL